MPSNFQAAIQLIITAATTDKPQKEAVLIVGATPQYLIDEGGFPALDLIITGSTIDKVFFDHGMTKGLLERLDVILLNPKALYRSDTVPGGSVVVTFEVKGGRPVIAALHPNKLIGRKRCNVVASVYDKEAGIETRWQAKGLLVWTPPAKPVSVSVPVAHANGPSHDPSKEAWVASDQKKST
jgi:hypothetical protein